MTLIPKSIRDICLPVNNCSRRGIILVEPNEEKLNMKKIQRQQATKSALNHNTICDCHEKVIQPPAI